MANSRLAAALCVAALAVGCGGREGRTSKTQTATALTAEQQAAAAAYAELLGKQVDHVEATATVLSKVEADAASRAEARANLLQLAVAGDTLEKRLVRERPADDAVLRAALQKVANRRQQAQARLKAQVQRIRELDGGPDFFDKELRPLLEAVKDR
jgi:hypothetical protein